MTLGPCSTPPVFCQGKQVEDYYYFLFIYFNLFFGQPVLLNLLVEKVMSRVYQKVFFHLSSRKRSAQHRHRLGSARLARVADLGPEKA